MLRRMTFGSTHEEVILWCSHLHAAVVEQQSPLRELHRLAEPNDLLVSSRHCTSAQVQDVH
jgi:hypothetical protein